MAEGSVGAVYLDLVVRDTVEKQVQAMAAKAQGTAKQSFTGLEATISSAVEKAMSKVSKSMEAAAASASAAAAKAANAAQQAVQAAASGAASCGQQVENTVNKSFNKAVALAQAKVNELERAFDDVGSKLDIQWQNGTFDEGSKATQKLLEQQEKLYARIEAARERLAIEVQVAAQKQAAAEEAAAQRTARATEALAVKQAAAAKQGTAANPPPTDWKRTTALAVGFQSAASNAFAATEKHGRGLTSVLRGILKRFSALNKSTGSFGTRLKGIVSGALIFNGISASLRNVTTYLGSAINSTDRMKEAMANLKGAAATAAAPIIEILTPALVALANAAATVFSYISKLISFFTGKSVSAMVAAAKGMKNAASTAKKAMGTLAGFDEIERVGGNQSSGEETSDYNYDFEGQSNFLDAVFEQVTNKIKQMIEPLKNIDFGSLKESLASLGQSFLDLLKTISPIFDFLWFNILVPLAEWTIEEFAPQAIDMLAAAFETLNAALKPVIEAWDEFYVMGFKPGIEFIQDTGIGVLEEWEEAFRDLAGVFSESETEISNSLILLGQTLQVVWASASAILTLTQTTWRAGFTYLSGMVSSLIRFIISSFGGLATFLQGVFTADWQKAWEGLVTMAKSPVNLIIGYLNAMISAVVEGVNTLIKAANKLSFTVPDWVPGIGGEKFGFNLKTITAPQVPMLADGGVISQPTLAMMGEYAGAKSNPEIAAPQSLIEESVANVMQDLIAANIAGNEATVAVLREILEAVLGIEIGDEVIGRAADRYQQKMSVVRGVT